MLARSIDWLLALATGALLALMIDSNSQLALQGTPLIASWIAHGVGAAVALFIILYVRLFGPARAARNPTGSPPRWAYFGGIPGASVVVLAAITTNSSLGLSRSVAFMLLGQIIFGVLSNEMGFFGIPRKALSLTDIVSVFVVIVGSAMLIFPE